MAEIDSTKDPQSAKSIAIKLAISLAIGILIMLLPRPENLTPEGQRLLGLLATVVFLWVSEAVPIGATALIAGAGLILLKIQGSQAAWSPFASPAVMFVLMIMMFGVVLNEVGLAGRLMYHLIKFAGTKVKRLSFILAVGCTISSSVLHDATVTVIMVFAFVPVFLSMGMKPGQGHKLPTFFFMLIPLAASAGGFGTLLGGGRNPLAIEILQKFTHGQASIGFLEYIIIMFPICVLTAVATWAILWILFRPKEKELVGVSLDHPGPMSRKELGVLVVFLGTFVLWFMGDLTGWHYSVPAAFAILGFCAPGWISFRTICDKFPWESWIVFGAGVSLGVAMLDSGAGKFLAEAILPLLDGQPTFVVYYGFGFFGSFLSSLMSNSAAVALMLP
ncbi:MAG: sodium/sulfate symporter, partial [Deltaproteobacteria bacterium]|nr:sodium/sulfate symporter [Deltaproteobacteria bacterium]